MKFTDAYEEHFWSVYGFHGYRLRSKAETEDLTQETFERALKAWHRFDPEKGDLRAWLLRIARNAYIDHRRREGSRPQVVAEAVGETAGGSEPSPDEEMALDPEIASALGQLSRREREAIALRFGGDLTTAGVASVLGVSTPNAQQILSRALRRLRSSLDLSQPGTTESGSAAAAAPDGKPTNEARQARHGAAPRPPEGWTVGG